MTQRTKIAWALAAAIGLAAINVAALRLRPEQSPAPAPLAVARLPPAVSTWAYTIEVFADGDLVTRKAVDYPQDLAEELRAIAIRWAVGPSRYPIDPDTGLLDLAHPIPQPRIMLRIWDPQREGGTWVNADGLTTSAPDGFLPVEVTVHIGSANR